jgi:putative SOS response-associated peptidase YedK
VRRSSSASRRTWRSTKSTRWGIQRRKPETGIDRLGGRDNQRANFTLAGIWAEWRDPSGIIIRTCSIVTCAANEQMRPYHDRMPVILDPPQLEAWIDPKATPEQLKQLMVPYAGTLTAERTTL